MWAVYLCGATDCFLAAMFMDKNDAQIWADKNNNNPEGYMIKYWESPKDIDETDTGWHL